MFVETTYPQNDLKTITQTITICDYHVIIYVYPVSSLQRYILITQWYRGINATVLLNTAIVLFQTATVQIRNHYRKVLYNNRIQTYTHPL